MKLLSQVLAAVALMATSGTAEDYEATKLSEKFGEPHGDLFSDEDIVGYGQTELSITIRTGERVNGVGMNGTNLWGTQFYLYHGGDGGDLKSLTPNPGERFQCLEAHWGAYHGRTRIRYIRVNTTTGRELEGGTPTTRTGTTCAPDGFQLGGFYGSSGVELDQIGAIWVNNKPRP
ncbi:uncharacterized protein IUM83_19040 [Phytophthora cinnamomi]|uniref:uncharacterized protein n=1 Tax=Phytophthora cinnamomi TaxID=4785 RepID=UPI003559B3D9|nr:hypothetical protein IUM83_19040 [Phytophthora cinnamomi]